MVLRKILRKEEGKVERYSVSVEKCQLIPDEYNNIINMVASRLGDYCEFDRGGFNKTSFKSGEIIEKEWGLGDVNTDKGRIQIQIRQAHFQPWNYLVKAMAKMEYNPGTAEEDLDIIRNALTSSGLEKLST